MLRYLLCLAREFLVRQVPLFALVSSFQVVFLLAMKQVACPINLVVDSSSAAVFSSACSWSQFFPSSSPIAFWTLMGLALVPLFGNTATQVLTRAVPVTSWYLVAILINHSLPKVKLALVS